MKFNTCRASNRGRGVEDVKKEFNTLEELMAWINEMGGEVIIDTTLGDNRIEIYDDCVE